MHLFVGLFIISEQQISSIKMANKNRTIVCGDIHGAYKALRQCFERSEFDYEKDTLICLGDVADGWPEVPQCIEELLRVKNLIYIMGNHDEWLDKWFKTGWREIIWTEQGGQATLDAYLNDLGESIGEAKMIKHREFFNKAQYHYIDDKNRLFVHAGYNTDFPFSESYNQEKVWTRDLFDKQMKKEFIVEEFEEIFIGHTTTESFEIDKPTKKGNVWMMDQGAGWGGKLTFMDINTKEFWQSDIVKTLYPGIKGR